MNTREIYTVGHSNHQIDYFLELLKFKEINCLIDVRSMPSSSYSPQFNKLPLKNYLKNNGITYMHFKDEFGARHEQQSILDKNGQVNFELFRKTNKFQKGIERVEKGFSKGYKIVLMCSEGDPLECHRFSMISVHLNKIGYNVYHILKNKIVKTHIELEQELLKKYQKKLPKPSLFEPNINEGNIIKEAYKLHNKEIGWITSKFGKLFKSRDINFINL